MAVQKNTTNNNEGSGFKTVAFGFDKNDVTMYIASLRKKMKAMEESYEQKIEELSNGIVSTPESTHHEDLPSVPMTPAEETKQLEAIRIAAEEYYSQKLEDAKNQAKQLGEEFESYKEEAAETLKHTKEGYEAKIEKIKSEYEDKLENAALVLENTKTDYEAKIQTIKADVAGELERENRALANELEQFKKSYAEIENSGKSSSEELKKIQNKLAKKEKENRTLTAQLEALKKNSNASSIINAEALKSLGEALAGITLISEKSNDLFGLLSAQKAQLENSSSENEANERLAAEADLFDEAVETDSSIDVAPLTATESTEEKTQRNPVKPVLDISEFTAPMENDEGVKVVPKAAELKLEGLDELIAEDTENSDAADEYDADLSNLLASSEESHGEFRIEELDVKHEKGEDLGDDLYEIIINPDEEIKKADLNSMLEEQKENDKKKSKNFDIQPNDIDNEFASLIAAAEASVSPDFDKKLDEAAKAQEQARIEAENDIKPLNSENDVFNFAFNDNNGSEDDDMSTDNFGFSEMM